MKGFVLGLLLASVSSAPARVEIKCEPVMVPEVDCSLGYALQHGGKKPTECDNG